MPRGYWNEVVTWRFLFWSRFDLADEKMISLTIKWSELLPGGMTMNIWLPEYLYRMKPHLFLIVAVIILAFGHHFWLSALALILLSYTVYIYWARWEWKDSGAVH